MAQSIMPQPISAIALKRIGIAEADALKYEQSFAEEGINTNNIQLLDKETLDDLGVKKLGHKLSILKLYSKRDEPLEAAAKIPPAKPPQLTAEMSKQAFRKFKLDWEVFCELSSLPVGKQHAQLYNAATDEAQTAIINTYPDFFTIPNKDLMQRIESVVTQKINPMVNRVKFSKLSQSSTETIQAYAIRLRSAAKECNFLCPQCETDISDVYIKDQLVSGVFNQVLQADILSKAEMLTNVNDTIRHAEAFESALRDQNNINFNNNEEVARISSNYKRSKAPNKTQNTSQRPQYQRRRDRDQSPCNGCGRYHTKPYKRDEVCPAWGKTCNSCGVQNHFSSACRRPKRGTAYNIEAENSNYDTEDATMSALIAHVNFDMEGKIINTTETDIVEIDAEVMPFLPQGVAISHKLFKRQKLKIFPDSGASICLGGLKHLSQLGVDKSNLIKCNKVITAVGNHKMACLGWIPVQFWVNGNGTKQALYICDRVQRLYFSKRGCIDVGILPKSFPFPSKEYSIAEPEIHNTVEAVGSSIANQPSTNIQRSPIPTNTENTSSTVLPDLPTRPEKTPYPATVENVPKLKQWLLEAFKSTAFCKTNKYGEFPTLAGPTAHIHLKEGAKPRAKHSPIPVPFHMKKAVKEAIDDDVKRGILKQVPVGMPTQWCSTMVVTAKKDGRPRRTIDYQHLNDQCLRETHHQGSPFHLAMQVPSGSFKTVLDAVDGYHSVPLDAESQPITTFITEWGRYMYARMPQGFLASGDAYTSRYDQVIIEVPRKVKIVDDVLLHDANVENAFFHTFDFLTLGFLNGIVFNIPKFTFCEMEVEFAGLRITAEGVAPAKSMLTAIVDFPTPTNLTDARSWFGLINQVAWAYSIGPIMQPFRDLIKAKSEFVWNQTMQNAFDDSKKVIVQLVEKGVSTFDVKRVTCLAPDWSKTGMGFLLLQKYCDCTLTKAPVCCPDGWHLVFAGSRYCTDAEARYAPVEGEASAIAWALSKCRMFVMGCPNLLVVTDHAPLLGIFGDRDLSKITNPRLFKLKEKTMMFRFTIQHCPGKWQRGADALSRNVAAATMAIFEVCSVSPNISDEKISSEIESCYASASAEAIADYGDDSGVISLNIVRAVGLEDPTYSCLVDQISKGFPKTKHLTNPLIREYWEVRNRLSVDNGLVLMDRRIVIPMGLRKRILKCLHSAHQGVIGMKARAHETVYWPGMDPCINNHRDTCATCIRVSPSLPREPLILTTSPEWPFQKIVMDLFYVDHHVYLACADRFTGWLIMYHLPAGKSNAATLINISRNIFQTYGVPEEISRDGGPPMQSKVFLDFLKDWGVEERVSSVSYAQSNGRAELAVKAGKRIIYDNAAPNGSLDTNRIARAVLQYRNTPIQGIGLSPAQLLLHRQLRDCLPTHPTLYRPHKEWVKAGYQREGMLAKRNEKLLADYNSKAHSLSPLSVGDMVVLQNHVNKRWDRMGFVVEVLPYRQYNIRLEGSGRVTLRNRRFLKKVSPIISPTSVQHPRPHSPNSCLPNPQSPIMPSNTKLTHPAYPANFEHTANPEQNAKLEQTASPQQTARLEQKCIKTPRALHRLLNFNNPGIKEEIPPLRRKNNKQLND